jgi:hypothetical protein
MRNPKYIQLTCAHCKKPIKRLFRQYKHQAKISGPNYRTFCNMKCQMAAKSAIGRTETTCDNCGKTMTRKNSVFNKFDHCFCSSACNASFGNRERTKNGYTTKGMTKQTVCRVCEHSYETSIHESIQHFVCADCKLKPEAEKFLAPRARKPKQPRYCNICGVQIYSRTAKYCDGCRPIAQQNAGIKAASSRNALRRSKNEMLFASLCEQNGFNITTNQNIFGRWDSDVQLLDYKIAVHWNGVWHYKPCGGRHSLKQVQNRDKFKYDAVIKCGWENYIIRDDGSFDETFVKSEFAKFKAYVDSKTPVVIG